MSYRCLMIIRLEFYSALFPIVAPELQRLRQSLTRNGSSTPRPLHSTTTATIVKLGQSPHRVVLKRSM